LSDKLNGVVARVHDELSGFQKGERQLFFSQFKQQLSLVNFYLLLKRRFTRGKRLR